MRLLSLLIPLLLASCSIDYMEDLVVENGSMRRSRNFHTSTGGEHVIETHKGDRLVHGQTKSLADAITGATAVAATRGSTRVGLAQEGTKRVEAVEGTKRIISGNETSTIINGQNTALEAAKIVK